MDAISINSQQRQYGLYRAAIVVILCACFLFYKYILQISPSVMSQDLMRAFSLDGAGLGFMAACYFYTYAILQIPAGMLLDRYGLRLLLGVTVLIAALGGLLFSQSHYLVVADLARGLIGVGAAFATSGYMKSVSIWIPKRHHAVFSGLFGSACMLGATFASSPIALLVTHIGWRATLLWAAGIGLLLCLFILLFIPSHKHCRVERVVQPIGLFKGLKKVLLTWNNWPLLVFNGLSFAPVAVYGGLWGVPFLEQSYHYDRAHAAFSASLIFLGLAVGGPILGWLSDRLDSRKGMIYVGVTVGLICLLVLIYINHLPNIVVDVLTFAIGFGLSSFLISYTITIETNVAALSATAIAIVNTGAPVFGSIAEPMIGRLLDYGWTGQMHHGVRIFSVADYHHALIVLPIYLIISLVAMRYVKI